MKIVDEKEAVDGPFTQRNPIIFNSSWFDSNLHCNTAPIRF